MDAGYVATDCRYWHIASFSAMQQHVRSWGKTRSSQTLVKTTRLTQSGHSAQRLQLCAMQTLKSPMCGPLVALLPSKRDPRKPANESGHSSYRAADINCDAVGIG